MLRRDFISSGDRPKREVEFIEVLPSVQGPKGLFVGSEMVSIRALMTVLSRPKRGGRPQAQPNIAQAIERMRLLLDRRNFTRNGD